MLINNLSNTEILNSSIQAKLYDAGLTVQNLLTGLAAREDWLWVINTAFEGSYDLFELEEIRQQWLVGDFSFLPEVEVLSSAELNGANGAYAAATNKIYLSEEFLERTDLDGIANVLVEEIGHYVDAEINEVDAPGDEGAIFYALVSGGSLNQRELEQLKTEDDLTLKIFNNKLISLETQLANNSRNTVFYHPTLSSEEILLLSKFSYIAYKDKVSEEDSKELRNFEGVDINKFDSGKTSQEQIRKNLFTEEELEGWEAITPDLIEYGLSPSRIRDDSYFKVDILNSFDGEGDASAIVFKKDDTLAIAFRGTDSDLDMADWLDTEDHFKLFYELIIALQNYLGDHSISRILLTGHSLGGAVVEHFLDFFDGSNLSVTIDLISGESTTSVTINRDGNIVDKLSGVTFASPQASLDSNETRVLNIGFENDPVYSIAGISREINATTNYSARLGDNRSITEDGSIDDGFARLHPVYGYVYSTERVLSSRYYNQTRRNSRIVIDLSDNIDEFKDDTSSQIILGENNRDDSISFDSTSINLVVEGLGGSDSLEGGRGSDTLDGGNGNDFLDGGSGDDFLDGSFGDDTLRGESGNDTLEGKIGNDSLDGGSEGDFLDGGFGDDTLRGGGQNDTLIGNNGDDSINGQEGNDYLFGGAGNDILNGENGNDVAFFSNAFTDHSIETTPNNSIRVTLTIASGDSSVTELINVESAQFSDKRINLSTGVDLPLIDLEDLISNPGGGSGRRAEFIQPIRQGLEPSFNLMASFVEDSSNEVANSSSGLVSPEDIQSSDFSLNSDETVASSEVGASTSALASESSDTETSATESSSLEASDSTDTSVPDNFITEIRDVVIPVLQQLENLDDDVFDERAEELFFEALGPDGLGVATIEDDIQVTSNFSEENENITIDLSLGASMELTDPVSLEADFGLPWLGLEVEAGSTARASLDFETNFSFGYKDGGFFFETPDEDDEEKAITFEVTTSIPELNATGNLGFLQVNVQDDGTSPSEVSLGGGIDFDVNILGDDVSLGDFDFNRTGSADLNLNLETAFIDPTNPKESLDILPSIGTDLNLDWDFFGDNNSPQVAFNNVTLDLGTFFTDFVSPIAQEINDFLKPIDPLIDLLETRVPILDDFARGTLDFNKNGVVEIIDLPNTIFGDEAEGLEFINFLRDFRNTVASIGNIEGAIPIDIGSFNFSPSRETIEDGSFDISSDDFPIDTELAEGVLGDIEEKLSEIPSNEGATVDFSSFAEVGEGNARFPLLETPELAFDLLRNKNVDLFIFDLPELRAGATLGIDIPILGILEAQLKGGISAGIDLNIGYDTEGLRQFVSDGDATKFFDGFFISDSDVAPSGTAPEDIPEEVKNIELATLEATVEAFAVLDVVIASAGVGGGVLGTLGIVAEDDDGKLRVSEFDETCYSLTGELAAGLSAFIKFGFGPFSWKKKFSLAKVTLLDFATGCDDVLGEEKIQERNDMLDLATIVEDDVLRLNMGEFANQRNAEELVSEAQQNAEDIRAGEKGEDAEDLRAKALEDNDEFFTVRFPMDGEGSGTLEVYALGRAQQFEGITLIEADGRNDDDTIVIADEVNISASLSGGNGDDQIFGGAGDDTIEGGNDEDDLNGGDGNDSLLGGSGDDFLNGGRGNDTLNGGSSEGEEDNDEFDVASYADAPNGINVNLTTGITTDDGYGTQDTLVNIEQIEASNHDDTITGSEDDDVISGLAGDDLLTGRDGNDVLIGNFGADTLDGGEGDRDFVSYFESNAAVSVDLGRDGAVSSFGSEADGDVLINIEYLQGTASSDRLFGNNSNNLLEGLFGDDTIAGGAGNDELDGGGFRDNAFIDRFSEKDTDLLTYREAPSEVEVSLKEGIAREDGYGNEDTIIRAKGRTLTGDEENREVSTNNTEFSSFENLEGSSFDDELEGDLGENIIYGLSGNDTLKGDAGNDTLVGGAGADLFDGGEGIEVADYSDSSVAVTVNLLGVGLGGDAEGDTFVTLSGGISTVENILGSDFGDNLIGGNGDNRIDPGLSNGYFGESRQETDFVDGGLGNDTLVVDYSQQDFRTTGITGGFTNSNAHSGTITRKNIDDNNIIQDEVSFENIEASIIIGTLKGDRIQGGAGNDTLLPGAGNDTISGGNGNDSLRGEEGNDVLSGDNGNDTLEGGEGSDNLDGGNGNDSLSGGEGDDLIDGGFGSNRIDAGQGNDFIQASEGTNRINGGEGIDKVSYINLAPSSFGVFVDLASNSAIIEQLTKDTLESIENVEGSLDRDVINGDDNDNELDGNASSDTLVGGAGIDTLLGGSGDDVLEGGTGADSINGGEGIDTASYVSSTEGVEVNLNDEVLESGGDADGDSLSEIEDLEGSNFDDILSGDANDNTIVGVGGNDLISGEDGQDTLSGKNGSDTLLGGNGNDSLLGGNGDDFLYGNGDADTLFGGQGNDILYSNNLSSIDSIGDSLNGESGNDFLLGGDGADTLLGGGQSSFNEIDTLTGGAGRDRFILGDEFGDLYDDRNPQTTGANNYALITDFNPDEDVLVVHKEGFNSTVLAFSRFYEVEFISGNTNLYRLGSQSESRELIAIVEDVELDLSEAQENSFMEGIIKESILI